MLFQTCQEIRDAKQCMCAAITLDNSGLELNNRVANAIYESCRTGQLDVPSFPNFQPLISALKSGQTCDRTKSFRVSAQRHDQLLILESLAKKWTQHEATAEDAKAIIEAHNEEYNNSGEYWIPERTVATFHSRFTRYQLKVLKIVTLKPNDCTDHTLNPSNQVCMILMMNLK